MYQAFKSQKEGGAPHVELAPGAGLVGAVHKATDRDVPVYTFKGIPFAQPPVGELRFQPPQPAELWQGDRQATEYGAICMQDKTMLGTLPGKIKVPEAMSEDCLFLNVWTPTLDQNANKAVMVYIHGGGFTCGWSDMYEGTAICSYEDVVFVSFNYRNGIFGFLSTNDDVVPGNMGLKDQVEALRWVQKYITRFGGDPNNVTIYGESAGAISVSLLMLTDEAAGLFHKGICQSGSARMASYLWSPSFARQKIAPVLETLGCKSEDSAEILEFLKGQTAEAIIAAIPKYDSTVRPVADGTFIQAEHVLNFKNEKSAAKPFITGCNSHEGAMMANLFAQFNIPDMKSCEGMIDQSLGFVVCTDKADHAEIKKRSIKEYFEGCRAEDITKLFVEWCGDLIFVYPSTYNAEMHCDTGDTYEYFFSKRPGGSKYPEWAEADHGDDIHFINGSSLYDYAHLGDFSFDEEDAKLSKAMMKYWANFARTGNPNGEGLPEWPKYTKDNKVYIHLNNEITTGTDLRADKCAFWKEMMDKYSPPIY